MRYVKLKIIMIAGIAVMFGCSKGGGLDQINGEIYKITGNAESGQLVPAPALAGTGSLVGFFDKQANTLNYTVTWTNLWPATVKDTITSVTFYGNALAGQNGTLIQSVPQVSTSASGTLSSSLSGFRGLVEVQSTALVNGKCYYLFCTKKYPAGIIRGQLSAILQ